MAYTYEYPRPALTVDAVVFAFDDQDLKVLLIQRALAPFAGKWALPGGFVQMHETLETAVRRELKEEAGLANIYLEQLYTFGEPNRDPRGRTVSVAYYALVKLADHQLVASTDAKDAAWFPAAELPPLAFDHEKIVAVAHRRLQGKVRYQPIGFELLPKRFTLSQLQHLYETVLERPLDKRNFRKKILSMAGGGLLIDTGEIQQDVSHRAARLFSFDQKKYQALEKKGFNFEI
jgi:8-oxo-dGTP diphosphatase